MKAQVASRRLMYLNQLILLLLMTTFAMCVIAAPVSAPKATRADNPEAKTLLLAKGQPYVPPKQDTDNC